MDINIEGLQRAVAKSNVKSCLVQKDGEAVFTYYKNKKIKNNLQRINSCTKSVLSILIGIALDQGLLRSLDTTVAHYFPEIINGQADVRKRAITIKQLLTMSPGLDWPEFGEWNYMPPMTTRNLVRFVLDRPLISEPGVNMNYNSGCSHVLSAILTKAAGMKTSDFAKTVLFGPLGIPDFLWFEDAQGISYGSDGLRLHPASMIRLGQLYLQEGVWNGKAIVSAEWVRRSTQPRLLTYDYIGHYGYHWWSDSLDPKRRIDEPDNVMYFAMGVNGQFIIVIPAMRTVAVFTSMLENTILPLKLVRTYISG